MAEAEQQVRLIYYSCRAESTGAEDLKAILEASRERNAREGISGLLAFDHRYFMQLLEGPAGAINDLYADLINDRRHFDLRLIEYVPCDPRRFPQWSMALAALPDFPGRFVEQTLGGFNPPVFSPDNAREYLEILRDYLAQTDP